MSLASRGDTPLESLYYAVCRLRGLRVVCLVTGRVYGVFG